MIGNPGDTKKTIEKNIRFANKINPDLIIVNITTPFPGTEMFEWAKKNDLILSYDWNDYDLARPVMKLKNMNEKEILSLYYYMYRKFYLRPKFILYKLMKLRSIDDIQIYFDGFKALIKFLISK